MAIAIHNSTSCFTIEDFLLKDSLQKESLTDNYIKVLCVNNLQSLNRKRTEYPWLRERMLPMVQRLDMIDLCFEFWICRAIYSSSS